MVLVPVPLLLLVSVVGAYVAEVLSVMDFTLYCISLLGARVWDAMWLLAVVPLMVALWQHRQRRRGRESSPLPGGVMLWLVPMVTIILLLFLFGFWLACSTPFRMVFVS